MDAIHGFCEEKGLELEDLATRKKQTKTWGRIAKISGIKTRDVY